MTRQEAKAAGLVALTADERLNAKVQTAYGELLWSEWCKREALRLREAGRRAEIVEEASICAVWVSPAPHAPPRMPPSG